MSTKSRNDLFKSLLANKVSSPLPVKEMTEVEQLTIKPEEFPLYDYQKLGVDFLLNKKDDGSTFGHNKRCILADDMGLGKTLQTIAAVTAGTTGRVLIVSPKNAKPVWKNELLKWLGEDCEVCTSIDSFSENVDKIKYSEKRFIIVNFEMFRNYHLVIGNTRFNYFVFDEAHKLRNQKTALYKSVKHVMVNQPITPCVMITGTPLINTPGDLYSLLHLLHPEEFSNRERFLNAHFYIYGGNKYRHKNVDYFQKLMSHYMMRRMRKDVISLPPVKKIDIPVELTGKQRKTYEEIRDYWMRSIEGQDSVPIMALIAQITKLKQCSLSENLELFPCCEGAKLDVLLDLLEEIQGQTVICSCFKSYLRPLKDVLVEKGYRVGLIDGGVSEKNREELTKQFQDGKLDIMMFSSKAGSESITLTNAENYIQLDKPWTAAEEDQAFGRVYRIGQERKVFRYNLYAENTIEQYIEKVIDRKRNLMDNSIPVVDIRRIMYGS